MKKPLIKDNKQDDNELLQEKINQLNQLKETIRELEKENGNKSREIESLKKEKEDIKNKGEEKVNEIKDKNKTLEDENEKVKKEIEELKSKTKLDLESKNNEINKLKEKIRIYENNEEKNNLEKDPLEFYDIIVDINSMQNIKKDGWQIMMNEKGKQITESKEEIERLVIGVLGNKNKGKSFLLQALSGEKLQTGSSINTIGLSIKFCEDKYVLLDCAGSESPLLGQQANMLEISRDKLFTEAFLQTYILRKCNLLLLVIGNLTFSEQKLINKISKDLEKLGNSNSKNIYNKKLIIIHNLQTFETVKQVQNYINNTLLKSATFKLKKGKGNFDDTGEYFYEEKENNENKRSEIIHFIYAKEYSEAGEFYNKSAIKLIKNYYNIEIKKYKYDYKETIKEHFNYMGKQMYDLKGKTDLNLEDINENPSNHEGNNEFNIIKELPNKNLNKKNKNREENENNEIDNEKINNNLLDNKLIKYSSKLIYKGEEEKLVLQKMVIDELGISNFIKNDFNPDFECYYTDKELIIKIECPEGVKLTAKRKRNKNGEYPYGIEIIGEKVEEKKIENAKYLKNKQHGKFYCLFPFEDPDYGLEKGSEEEPSNGWKIFKFPISKIEDD